MKKILALFFSLQAGLHALYLGNPAEPELIDEGFFIAQDSLFSVKAGYQGDIVFNRRLKAQDGVDGSMDQFAMHLNQGVVALNFIDRAEGYVSFGALDADFSHRLDGERREYHAPDRWTVGGGLRILLVQWNNTCLGFNGGYQFSEPHVQWVAVDGLSYDSHARLIYREWQIGFALSHTVDLFTPYLGVTYSDVDASLERISADIGTPSHFKMVSRERIGMTVGCSLSSGKKVDLNFETRFFDEQAATVSGNIKF